MDICLYNNNIICAFDVTNINEVLNYEIAAEWREAGRKGLLKCPECGSEVRLRVKDIKKKVPHFSHKTKSSCSFGEITSKESEEHKKGKLKIYHYFRKMYPDADISISKNFSNKRRTDLYIEFKSGEKLAVEFQRTDLDKSEWKIRHDFYKDNGINDLWFINGNVEEVLHNEKQLSLSFFEQVMLNEERKMAIYFDIYNLKICLSKNIRYVDKLINNNDSEILFNKSYDIDDIKINPDGSIECSFFYEYEKAAEEFVKLKEKESLELLKKQKVQQEKEQEYQEYIEKQQKYQEELNRKKKVLNEKTTYNRQQIGTRQTKYTREQFKPGTKIYHKTFGESEIIEVNGNFVLIRYDRNKTHNISLNNCLKGIIVKLIEE